MGANFVIGEAALSADLIVSLKLYVFREGCTSSRLCGNSWTPSFQDFSPPGVIFFSCFPQQAGPIPVVTAMGA